MHHKKIWDIFGDKTLKTSLYNEIYFLKEYDQYLDLIQRLNKNQLMNEYKDVYGYYSHYIFFNKQRMAKDLLYNKKQTLLTS
jgi:hypothetical protein